jgi:di/tricarboxylate transporter
MLLGLKSRIYQTAVFAIACSLILNTWGDILFAAAQPSSTAKPSPKPTRSPTHRKSIYGDFANDDVLPKNEQQGIVGALIIGLFLCMAFEIGTPEVLFLIALMVVIFCEILTLSDGLAGFANSAMITIGALYLVVGAIEKSHIIDWFARNAFGTTGETWVGKLRLYVASFCLSIFLNNTPIVAILMPIVKDWSRMRGLAASQLLMPFEFAVIAGSFGSMIGTSTNLTLQGLMLKDRNFGFDFFAPAPIGFPCFAALLIYMMFAGHYLLPHTKSGLLREARDKASSMIAEVYVGPESPSVGKSLEAMMGSLGVSPQVVIKIRRRTAVANQDVEGGSPRKATKSGVRKVFDRKYWQNAGNFWSTSSSKEVNAASNADHGEYTLAKSDDLPVADAEGEDGGEQEYTDIVVPDPHEIILAHDIVFVSSAQTLVQKMMKSIMGESKGLSILNSDVRDLPGYGSELVECVVSDSCEFLGKKVSEFSPLLAQKHGLGVITVRGKRWAENESSGEDKPATENQPVPANATEEPIESTANIATVDHIELTELKSASADSKDFADEANPSHISDEDASKIPPLGNVGNEVLTTPKTDSVTVNNTISDHVLGYGDILLCVTDSKNVDKLYISPDFFVVSTVGSLPKQLTFYGIIPLFVFLALLILAALQMIDICPGSMIVAAFFFMGGWITAKDIPKMVDIRLLLLLGASLSFATSMTKSGLAETIAQEITQNDPTPFRALVMVYAITLAITSLVSNNAAASLMYPIAVKVADQLSVSYKPFAMCVLIAASATYMVPVGYQTHIMVWAPGGYRFRDFLIFGAIPNAIYLVIACYLIPVLYPW